MDNNITSIAKTLAKRYATIYYVNLIANHYVEYSASDDYKELNVPVEGEDFFTESYNNIKRVIHPEDLESVQRIADKAFMISATENGQKFVIDYRLLMQDGTHYVRLNAVRTEDSENLIIALENIDSEKRNQAEFEGISEQNKVFSQIAESLANQYDTIYYVDMLNDHYIEFSSTDIYKSLDVQPSGDDFFSESLANIGRVIHPEDRAEFQHILDKSSLIRMLNEKHMITHTYRILVGEKIMYARLSVIWATDNKHLIVGVTNIDKEIRKERELAKQLHLADEKAYRDEMTGVKNKAAFSEFEERIQEQIRQGEAQDFAVVVCDVNGLKKINDTLGQKAGDEYIIAACRMVCEIFQYSPVFRIGGDEFVAVLTNKDFTLRHRLMQLLHDRSAVHIASGGVVVSGGLSDYVRDEDKDFHAVFERADGLMYEEKKLLKSMGAITRDETTDAEPESGEQQAESIIDVRRHILVVEDEDINQMMLGNILSEDYELLFASDGIEALEVLEKHKEDVALILLDLMMPRMNGTEFLEKIKGEADLKSIPVIVLTADQRSEVECLQIGAMDFLHKPYPAPEVIKARVNKCIELSEDRNIIQSTERDSLTKLFNIDYFISYVKMFDQYYEDQKMDAVIIDVNRFHMITERYGKDYGDTILRKIGERVRQLARKMGGVGCRRGADTFLIYAPHREDYAEILEKLTDELDSGENQSGRVRLRMGVYYNVDRELEIERRFDRAKIAADSIKGNYAVSVGEYDSELHESALFRERLLEDFKENLEQKCFEVYFQPKFDIRPDIPVLSSAEALVRWKHPELGMISPGVFIPLLEDNGMILSLDRYVWEETAIHIRSWKDKYDFSVPVSVNVSRIDMLMPNLKEIFKDITGKYELTSDDIILEITESAYTGDSEQVISTARELRGMGFRIEMDDFGTGYSSLGMLSNLPIDVLKLDMSFVRNAFGENKDVRIIELIIDIADYLHIPVVAEGVETKEQYMTLKAMGCDIVQGYYFSKPVPCSEFEKFLIERKKQDKEEIVNIRKNHMSISKALTYDFESIYYIDIQTYYYLEFYSGKNGELQIYSGGADFFTDVREKLLKDVGESDFKALSEALEKDNLMKWINVDDAEILRFARTSGEGEVNYSLHTLCTKNKDDHHIVIGLKPF